MSKQPIGLPAGIYCDLSAERYHADPALSSSGLKTLLKSPYKYWHDSAMNPNRKPADTATMKNGRAFHTMLLEPEKFDEEFTVKAGCKSSSVAGMVGEGDYNDMKAAAQAIRDDSSIAGLLTGGKPEVSIFWRDEETGVMCRVRFDYLRPMIGFDYKTISDIEAIPYAVADYRYDISAAMYTEGLRAAGLYEDGHLGFVDLFQEKKAPYVAKAKRLSDEIMQVGHDDFRRGLSICQQNIERYGVEKWHSGSGGVEELGIDEMPFKYRNLGE